MRAPRRRHIPDKPWVLRVLPVSLLLSIGCGDNMGTAIGPAPTDAGALLPAMHAVSTRGRTSCATGNGALFTRGPDHQAWRPLSFDSDDTDTLADLRLFAVRCLSPTSMVAVGSIKSTPPQARVAVATWGQNATLTVHNPETQGDLFALAPTDSNTIVAVGYQADPAITSWGLNITDPLGGSWASEPALGSWLPLRGFWAQPNGERVAVGDAGTLLHSAGATRPYISETNPRGAVTMRAVWAPEVGPFVAAGDLGVLLHRVRRGVWESMPSAISTSADWRALHGTSENNIFAVGSRVIAYFDGVAWREITNISGLPSQRSLRSVWVDPSTQPPQLHLAGDQLLTTCTVRNASPPSLECAP